MFHVCWHVPSRRAQMRILLQRVCFAPRCGQRLPYLEPLVVLYRMSVWLNVRLNYVSRLAWCEEWIAGCGDHAREGQEAQGCWCARGVHVFQFPESESSTYGISAPVAWFSNLVQYYLKGVQPTPLAVVVPRTDVHHMNRIHHRS